MTLEIREKAAGRILIVHATGKLTRADSQRLIPEADVMIAEHGKIRVLFVMDDFHGWEPGAMWDEFKFGVQHHNDVERVAIVGDRKWEEWIAIASRPFTSAEVRYFDLADFLEARAWIESQL